MPSPAPQMYVIATEPLAKIPYDRNFIVGYVSTQLDESDDLIALAASGVIRSVTVAEHAQYQTANTARTTAITTAQSARTTVVSDAETARDVILGLD